MRSVYSAACCVRYVVHCVQHNMSSVIAIMLACLLITPPIISEQTSNVNGNFIEQSSRMLGAWERANTFSFYCCALDCSYLNLKDKIL